MQFYRKYLFLLLIKINLIHCIWLDHNDIEDESFNVEYLKEIFFKNLLEDYIDIQEKNVTKKDELEIGKKVDAFLALADRYKDTEYINHVRKRRQADDLHKEAHYFSLKGFTEMGSLPVDFPLDICLLKVGEKVFGAALHLQKSSDIIKNTTILSLYKKEERKFIKISAIETISAKSIDCISHKNLGFIAIVNNYDDDRQKAKLNKIVDEGSPIFRLHEDEHYEIVQMFKQPHQNSVHMWAHGTDIYLTHTYNNLNPKTANICPVYKWSGFHFDVIDELPCFNSVHIEPFSVYQNMYVAVANPSTFPGEISTFSHIFKFNLTTSRFQLHQKIYTNLISSLSYLYIENEYYKDHYLITGNSLIDSEKLLPKDKQSIIYKYVNGFFVPFQNIELLNVKKFLAVPGKSGQFILLVLCNDRPIQIYEYDGFKFSESEIDYTGQAFDVGVSSMRVYRHIYDKSLIVIANVNSFAKRINIFTPKYSEKNDLQKVYREFLDWSKNIQYVMSSDNLNQVYQQFMEIPKVAESVLETIGPLKITNSKINEIFTNSVHTQNLVFDQNLFDYLNGVHTRIQNLKKRIENAKKIIDESLKNNETIVIPGNLNVNHIIASESQVKKLDAKHVNGASQERSMTPNEDSSDDCPEVIEVDQLIVNENMNVQFLNGYATENLVRLDQPLNLPKIDIVVDEVTVPSGFFVKNEIDGIVFRAENLILNDVDQSFNETLYVDCLNVENLSTPKLNSTDFDEVITIVKEIEEFVEFRANEDIDFPRRIEKAIADDFDFSGLINDIDLKEIDKFALKTVGDQIIEAEFDFDNLFAQKTVVKNNNLSGVDLNNLILAEGEGKFEVGQDIQFARPLQVNELIVNNRLNQINVENGRLDVILKETDEMQTIRGAKTFEAVELLGPIYLQGKINSTTLNKMNPISTVSQDIVLEGDFEIFGNTTIKKLLKASNIFSRSKNVSVNDLHTFGLRFDAPSSNLKFDFQDIFVMSNMNANSTNDIDPSDFVRTGSDEIQKVTARKIFAGDLKINNGQCDAEIINKVDLKELDRTILKKTGDQIVEGTIHFSEIESKVLFSEKSSFENKQIKNLLSMSDEIQEIPGTLSVKDSEVHIFNTTEFKQLVGIDVNGIFNFNLDYMLEDSLRFNDNGTMVDSFITFKNVTFGSVEMDERANLNGFNPSDLEKMAKTALKNLTIEENILFPNEMSFQNVYFEGKLNDIPKKALYTSWLLSEYNQTFTAPQKINSLECDDGVNLTGLLNDFYLKDLEGNTYNLNAEERIGKAIFADGIVSHHSVTVAGTVSGLNLPNDVVLAQTDQPQSFTSLTIRNDLILENDFRVDQYFNGVQFKKLQEFLSSKDVPVNLKIIGNAIMTHQPYVSYLNEYNVDELHEKIWLTNRPVTLKGNLNFDNVQFMQSLYSHGTINELDLKYMSKNYFSLSRAQEVSTILQVANNVTLHGVGFIDNIEIKGLFRGLNSPEGINLEYFNQYVFRKGVDQTITGKWTLHNVEIFDDLKLETLNGYKLKSDILTLNTPKANVTGHKIVNELHVRNINCPNTCIMHDVNVGEWFMNAIRTNRNHTILGTTYLHDPVLQGNMQVMGYVNDTTFDIDTFLLKSVDQVIEGDVYVQTKFPKTKKIIPSLFENLDLDNVNEIGVNDFVQNLARYSEARNAPNGVEINTKLKFKKPLVVQHFQSNEKKLYNVNISQIESEMDFGHKLNVFESSLERLYFVGNSLLEDLEGKPKYLDHYEMLKSIPGSFASALAISLKPPADPLGKFSTYLALLNEDRKKITFHRWVKKQMKFDLFKKIKPISRPKFLISQFDKVELKESEWLYVEFNDIENEIFRQEILHYTLNDGLFKPIYEFHSNFSRKMVTMSLFDLHCVGLYSIYAPGVEIKCFHYHETGYILGDHQYLETPPIKQAVSISNRLILTTTEKSIEIWQSSRDMSLNLHQVIPNLHLTHISAMEFDQKLFLALSCSKILDTVHHGSIEIYSSSLGYNETFETVQTIATKNPRQITFSLLHSNDLVLYTLTKGSTHPLIIYEYAGVFGFKEAVKSTSLKYPGDKLAVFKVDHREFVIILAEKEAMLIEAIMKG